jgi:hypothetical protein
MLQGNRNNQALAVKAAVWVLPHNNLWRNQVNPL